MKSRIVLTAMSCAAVVSAAYTYDYSQNPVISDSVRWQTNGSVSFSSVGATFGGSGGSLLSLPAISGANSNDYEVNSTLALKAGGGTYIHFLRASSGAVEGSGSYVSVELVMPQTFSGSGTATLNMNQCTNGAVSTVASNSIAVNDGMSLRTVAFGPNVFVFVNNLLVQAYNPGVTIGAPGIGGYGMPAGSGFSGIKLGHHDTVAPGAISAPSIASSVFPTAAMLRWPGVLDDANGVGVFIYQIYRNGVFQTNIATPEWSDNTVLPATTYSYTFYAMDYHGNAGPPTTFSVTTPPAGAIDPHRPGLVNTGSYWGGGGEQIDTLSGNLNFSIPLVTAQGRAGWKVPVGLSYNSQNWRQDNGVNWQLGADVGYGYGWRMQIGSVTPYNTSSWYGGVDHFVFTDGSGAEYRLDQNNNGVWSSTQGVYVWFDQNANILHFKDGTFWVMGCTSGGTEADAGTMYPTIIEDVSGNQVIVTYDAGAGLPPVLTTSSQYYPVWYTTTPNSSARILAIEDVRACSLYGCAYVPATYLFSYDRTHYSAPHLTSITSLISTAESFSFTYTPASFAPPFGYDASYSGLNTVQLSVATTATNLNYTFQYDTAGASELTQVKFPQGGHLRWAYSADAYIGSRSLRAITGRYLAGDSAGAQEWAYPITRDNASSATVHGSATLTDASGNGAKTWKFVNSGAAWQLGLVSEFIQSASAGGTAYTDDTYAWSQDPGGNPYISTKVSVTDPGTANAQTAKSTQTQDQYGNVTQSAIYPYNNTSAPLRTYTSTYLNSGTYPSHYILNRLLTSTLTTGGVTKTLVQNTYDQSYYNGQNPSPPPTREIDGNPPVPMLQRGYLTVSTTPQRTLWYAMNNVGIATGQFGSDGTNVQMTPSQATNYAAPQSIATATYSQSLSYNSWLGVTSTTGLNGEQLAMTYDGVGRPTGSTSPYGATWSYSYSDTTSTALPAWQLKAGPDGYTKNTLDGLGRTIRTERGTDATHLQSVVDTVYAPCACSPLGKLQKVSTPYPSGQSATAWTVYAYDGIGRTLTVTQPDGASTTHYAYLGNQTTVTDPAGKWKQFTNDVQGNLLTVVEPDPANQPRGTLTTSYSYDWMNHVSGVSMPRGSVTQTRSFAYDDAGRLTSATNPENGTVTYAYNTDNTLQKKHDARGQDIVYAYDSAKRLTGVQYFPWGQNNVRNPWDPCEQPAVTYTYDTNPLYPNFSQYTQGRLTTTQYTVCTAVAETPVKEMYSYHPAGAVTAKRLVVNRCGPDQYGNDVCADGYVEADYTYNTAGQVLKYGTSLTTDMFPPALTFTYTYDSMARPVSLFDNAGQWRDDGANQPWAQSVQYDFAGRMSSLSVAGSADSKTWNANGQLSSQFGGAIQYTYSGTQNNGQITQMTNTMTGEAVSYQYDSLKRLVSASGSPTAGSSAAPWTQTFSYDGFGNLTGKTTNGTAATIAVDAATNRVVNGSYDANGNMWSGGGSSVTYDPANRVASSNGYSGGTEYYGYSPDNKRIYRVDAQGREEWSLFGAMGEKLGTYSLFTRAQDVNYSGPTTVFRMMTQNVWFAGQLVSDQGRTATFNRLGTMAAGARFYPYGDEITSTVNERVKFGSYYRDGLGGLDYAQNRYYASPLGRFTSPDPNGSTTASKDPVSWNRYAYVGGDPANRNDPHGLFWCETYDASCYCDPYYGCGACDPCDPYCSPIIALAVNGIHAACVEPIAPDPAPPPDPDCAQFSISAFQLDYSQKLYQKGTQTTQDHIIERHGGGITGVPIPGVSQYYASSFSQIQNFNAATFLFGTEVYDRVRNTIDFTWTGPQITPGGNHIGTGPSGTETATNLLILKPDCKTVITSYPIPGVD